MVQVVDVDDFPPHLFLHHGRAVGVVAMSQTTAEAVAAAMGQDTDEKYLLEAAVDAVVAKNKVGVVYTGTGARKVVDDKNIGAYTAVVAAVAVAVHNESLLHCSKISMASTLQQPDRLLEKSLQLQLGLCIRMGTTLLLDVAVSVVLGELMRRV